MLFTITISFIAMVLGAPQTNNVTASMQADCTGFTSTPVTIPGAVCTGFKIGPTYDVLTTNTGPWPLTITEPGTSVMCDPLDGKAAKFDVRCMKP